jgi:hypothetical protein
MMRLQKRCTLTGAILATSLVYAQQPEGQLSLRPNALRCNSACIEEKLGGIERMGYSTARLKYARCVPDCVKQSQDALSSQDTAEAACSDRCIDEYSHPPKRPLQGAPVNPIVRPSGNNRAFILAEPMKYEVGSTKIVITVPVGFVTDYASIPKSLWSLYSPHDQYSRAAIVHDYLYWSQLCTRKQADNLLMIAMKESEVSQVTRNNVYLGVIPIPRHLLLSSGVKQVQLRMHSDRIAPGICVNLFQASQQASTICS